MFESWYLGDGVYGDGPKFRWDYYNSFVIQPMYVDVLRTFADVGRGYDELLKQVEHRARDGMQRSWRKTSTPTAVTRSSGGRFTASARSAAVTGSTGRISTE